MKILITGHAGFIGFSLAKKLLETKPFKIYGIDNFNNYYDVNLKRKRNNILKKISKKKKFISIFCDIRNKKKLEKIFNQYRFDIVIHLAAQAGIRFSLKKPEEYITSNINGFYNILELSKKYKVKKFLYASSSSVYGNSSRSKFKESDTINKPLQLYAVSKISNELIAYTYGHLYNFLTYGLRFFTVYGPWGRPDMAIFKFTKKILNGEKINLYNFGKNLRDFTFIDDVTDSIIKIFLSKAEKPKYNIFNIGNNRPIETIKIVKILEKFLDKKAKISMRKKNIIDAYKTAANTTLIQKKYNIKINTSIETGLKNFITWFRQYYHL